MAVFELKKLFLPTILLLLLTITHSKSKLDAHYYDQTCPQAEKIILQNGCDASVLLDSTPRNQAEKAAPPNISLRSFYVIDGIKSKLESTCPRTVSCADILAIAARDVVTMSGGPYWNVLKGRKDGRVSRANETINLPAPTFNVSQLIQSFAMRGLGIKDLVSLSGGHTLGFSHCSSFASRLSNFNSVNEVDPTMNFDFALELRKKCPKLNKDRNAGEFLDSTSSTFDNNYYKQVVTGKGVFGSDQALFGDERTRWIVEKFAGDQDLFFKEFATSMVKLGNVGVVENGEVRLNCRMVN